ncbi:MlaE family ABC transporter permease [Comamonas composti]|uniref:MlaE family ABC transporter permease n=1 Tax=Comamonas composti TaxID=408558 RepID=UPI00047ABC83|nr:ABC transporter permease [Comamonas composti]
MNVRQATVAASDRVWAALGAHGLAWWRSIYLGAAMLVLVLSPSSYRGAAGRAMARQIYLQTGPVLLGFTALAALMCAVITHIVVVTAQSYGLSRYALEMVVRVLVIELIPLTAALFVAMRCTIPSGSAIMQMRARGLFDGWRQKGLDPLRMALVPRAAGGVFAAITLAALSCVVALITVYVSVYGFSFAGLPVYTRIFGSIFTPGVTLVFVLKTFFFGLTVAIMPLASGLYASLMRHQPGGAELGGFARMFAVLLLIEVVSLLGNYY